VYLRLLTPALSSFGEERKFLYHVFRPFNDQ
jgi:hypothetical protein